MIYKNTYTQYTAHTCTQHTYIQRAQDTQDPRLTARSSGKPNPVSIYSFAHTHTHVHVPAVLYLGGGGGW
jgi:hypothetical protein